MSTTLLTGNTTVPYHSRFYRTECTSQCPNNSVQALKVCMQCSTLVLKLAVYAQHVSMSKHK